MSKKDRMPQDFLITFTMPKNRIDWVKSVLLNQKPTDAENNDELKEPEASFEQADILSENKP